VIELYCPKCDVKMMEIAKTGNGTRFYRCEKCEAIASIKNDGLPDSPSKHDPLT